MKTNQCPLVGSSPRCRRTRADNPSKEQRISVGCVQSQIRPAEIAFNTTGSFALEEPHHPRAPAPHPTTRIGPAQPPRPRQTSIRTVRFAVPYFRAAYVSKDRRYSVTHPVTNRSSCAFDPSVQNAQSISPIRSQCGAGIASNHSFRSFSHSIPLCTKTSSQPTELHDWNDGLLWPLTSKTPSHTPLNRSLTTASVITRPYSTRKLSAKNAITPRKQKSPSSCNMRARPAESRSHARSVSDVSKACVGRFGHFPLPAHPVTQYDVPKYGRSSSHPPSAQITPASNAAANNNQGFAITSVR